MKPLRRAIALEGRERRAVVGAGVLLVVAKLAIPLLRLDRTRGVIAWMARRTRILSARRGSKEIGWAVETAGNVLPGRYRCLHRSIVGHALLVANGHSATFNFGVAMDDSDFNAHAWIECDGDVVIGDIDDLGTYRTFD